MAPGYLPAFAGPSSAPPRRLNPPPLSPLLSDLSGVRGGAPPPLFDSDNKCYLGCEAEEDGGNILGTDRNKCGDG